MAQGFDSLDGWHWFGLEQTLLAEGAADRCNNLLAPTATVVTFTEGLRFMRFTRSRRRRFGLAVVVLGVWGAMVSASQPAAVEPRKPKVPMLQVEQYALPNGLKVVLHEDHKTPVVAVNVWYRVGSKDEKPGRTGFAHLFEHMMFQGSKHHDSDYFIPLEKLGADLNGTTGEDDTIYYETVPSNALELALWLEADRMGFLLPSMTQERLDNQRAVVKNERRETVDNAPYGQAEEALLKALYPADHPYHHSVIGSMADLSAARLADVSAFFRTYYVPNNAILSRRRAIFNPGRPGRGSRSTSDRCRAGRRLFGRSRRHPDWRNPSTSR